MTLLIEKNDQEKLNKFIENASLFDYSKYTIEIIDNNNFELFKIAVSKMKENLLEEPSLLYTYAESVLRHVLINNRYEYLEYLVKGDVFENLDLQHFLIYATHNLNLFKFFLNLNFKYEKNEHYSLIKSFLMIQKFGKPNDNIFLDLMIEKHGFSFNDFIECLEGTKSKIEYFMSFIKKYDLEKSYLNNLEDCFQYMTEEDIKCYSIEANLNSF